MRVFFFFLTFFAASVQGNAQVVLSGKVSDPSGSPVAGAAVSIAGTFLGTTSDAKGFYRINNLKDPEALVEVKLLGYAAQQKRVNLAKSISVDWQLAPTSFLADEVVISATRADDKSGMAYTTLTKKEIQEQNFGQDMPSLLNTQPSVVVSSDAGAGIGYTGISVRGSDATRTNVTVNGIPMNDAESHQLYWVNMPDLASSVSSVQLQRGVGTSTNGGGAFGATLNLQTNEFKPANAGITTSVGSFGTIRNTLEAGTGLLNGFTVDLRLSQIKSDGYIDRASSDLHSFYASGAWYSKKTTIRANVFSGKEKTYQAWYGVPQDSLLTNRKYNPAGSYVGPDGKERFYDNQTDNYQQDHYQLFFSHELSSKWLLNLAFHYTHGAGYYEEYMHKDDLSDYGISPLYFGQKILVSGADTLLVPSDTITKSSLVRQRWLDNHFYGSVFSATWTPSNRFRLILGGAANQYDGQHFGEISWAEFASSIPAQFRYYQDTARKTDVNMYAKANLELTRRLSLFMDVQVRNVNYSFLGFNSQLLSAKQDVNLLFFNPKVGLNWDVNERHRLFASFSIGNREPVGDDFTKTSALSRPKPEHLQDTELGYRLKGRNVQAGLTAYYMNYRDQLVRTGAINDVGQNARINVPHSYRAGLELEASWQIFKWVGWAANLTLSRNKIRSFTEYVDDYDSGLQVAKAYSNTDIAASPSIIAASTITFKPHRWFTIALITKQVGKQYLDNTQSDLRKIDGFILNNLRVSFEPDLSMINGVDFSVSINNLFDVLYAPSGYTYSGYSASQRYDYNYYFPQAGRSVMGMIRLKF